MASLTLRNVKGSPLTNQEADDNLSNILVALGGTNASPYTIPTPSGTGSPVLTSGPTIDTPRITTELRINNTANTYYVGFKAGTLSANKVWTLPTTDGTANQVLKTDGSGNLGWVTGSTPAGSDTQLQFNSAGVLGASSALTWDGSKLSATNLVSTNSVGDEGGEILLVKPQTNSTIAGTGVTIDIYQNKLRIFEQGGTARGAYIDLTAASAGVGSNLLTGGSGGGGTVTSVGLSVPTDFLSVANTPVTSSGTIALSLATNPLLPKLLIGPTASANYTRFPNSLTAISNTASGIQKNEGHNIGLVAEGTAHATDTTIYGIGVYGKGYTNAATRSGGVVGEGHVSATGDTGSAIGVRGYANDTHAGGMNIGLYSDANNGANNYALYMNSGNITNVAAQTWTLGGNLTFSGAYSVTIPTLSLSNALTAANGGTGLTSPGTSGNVLTSNGSTWVSQVAPVSLPSQTGNGGKYLTTDGTTASWATVSGGGSASTGLETNFLLMGA